MDNLPDGVSQPMVDRELGEMVVEYDGCPNCIEELHDKGARCRRGCRCSCHGRES